MNNVETGVRECVGISGVRGCVVGKADAGRTGEREVRLIRVRTRADEARNVGGRSVQRGRTKRTTRADEARNAGGDDSSVQCRRAFVLEERDGGEIRLESDEPRRRMSAPACLWERLRGERERANIVGG